MIAFGSLIMEMRSLCSHFFSCPFDELISCLIMEMRSLHFDRYIISSHKCITKIRMAKKFMLKLSDIITMNSNIYTNTSIKSQSLSILIFVTLYSEPRRLTMWNSLLRSHLENWDSWSLRLVLLTKVNGGKSYKKWENL